MYEHFTKDVLTRRQFFGRLVRHAGYAGLLVAFSMGVGTTGYHVFAHQSWVDSVLNAAMLLGGMGPVGELRGTGAKLFASAFALYAGLVFVAAAGLLLAPIFHRVLHHFHCDSADAVE